MPATAVSSSSSGYKSSYTGNSSRSFDSYSSEEVSLRYKARNMTFNLMHALNKAAQKQIPTSVRTFLFIVELLQFLTFVIEPTLPYWGVGGTAIGNALRYITYVRTIQVAYKSQAAILWIAFVYHFYTMHSTDTEHCYVVIVLGLSVELAVFSLDSGEGNDSKRLKLLTFLTLGVLPVLYVYFIDTLFAFLNCTPVGGNVISARFVSDNVLCSATQNIAFMGFSFATLILLIPIMCVITLLMHRPSKGGKWGVWDLVNGRILFLLFVAKTILVAFLNYMAHIPTAALQGGVYTWLGMIISVTLCAYVVYFVPFLKKSANLIFIGVMSASTYGFFFAFIAGNIHHSAVSPTNVLIGLFISFIPIGAMVSAVCYFLRIKALYNWKYDHHKTFKRPFEVEICTRRSQQSSCVNEDQIINTFTLGLDQFRDDGFLKAAYATFLLEKKSDFHLLTITLDRARNTQMALDIKFLVFYIERERLNSTLAMDGGAEEIHKKLLAVKKHSKRAMMYIKTFWDVLLKEEDLESLPEIVASVELEEKRANTILQKLREKYPRNVSVLRHYAVFLEKVKNDPEAAHAALRAADEMEEEKSQRHRNKSVKKSKKGEKDHKSSVSLQNSRNIPAPKQQQPESQQNAELAAQVRFKEMISRPYTPALPHSVNQEQSPMATAGSSPRSPHDSAIIDNEDDDLVANTVMNRHSYEYLNNRQKSPIATTREDIPPPDDDVEQGYQQEEEKRKHHHHDDGESDKESNVTGSSFSFEQLKNMKRSDLMRYRKYRYLTENSKSQALKKLKIAINLTLLILLVDIVVVFATTQQMMVTFSSSVNGLASASNANYLLHNAALYQLQYNTTTQINNTIVF